MNVFFKDIQDPKLYTIYSCLKKKKTNYGEGVCPLTLRRSPGHVIAQRAVNDVKCSRQMRGTIS